MTDFPLMQREPDEPGWTDSFERPDCWVSVQEWTADASRPRVEAQVTARGLEIAPVSGRWSLKMADVDGSEHEISGLQAGDILHPFRDDEGLALRIERGGETIVRRMTRREEQA